MSPEAALALEQLMGAVREAVFLSTVLLALVFTAFLQTVSHAEGKPKEDVVSYFYVCSMVCLLTSAVGGAGLLLRTGVVLASTISLSEDEKELEVETNLEVNIPLIEFMWEVVWLGMFLGVLSFCGAIAAVGYRIGGLNGAVMMIGSLVAIAALSASLLL